MDTIGERFREIRKILDLNQRQFAAEIGISQTHISSIELGKDLPSSSLIKLVCMKYNLSEEWLLSGKGAPTVQLATVENDVLEKYNALRIRLERELRESSEEDVTLIVDAFDMFVSLFTIPNKFTETELTPAEKHEYFRSVRKILICLWKLISSVTLMQRLLPSTKDARGWWDFKNKSEALLDTIQNNAKRATNLFLSVVEDVIKL